MAEVRDLPGGGAHVTVITEAVDVAVAAWLELPPEGLVDWTDIMVDEFGEDAAASTISEIVEWVLLEYHSALHHLERGDVDG